MRKFGARQDNVLYSHYDEAISFDTFQVIFLKSFGNINARVFVSSWWLVVKTSLNAASKKSRKVEPFSALLLKPFVAPIAVCYAKS